MKLKKLLKYLDEYTNLIIWDQVGLEEEKWEVVFEGCAFETPWYLVDRHLITFDDNGESGAMSAYKKDDGDYGLRITLADE